MRNVTSRILQFASEFRIPPAREGSSAWTTCVLWKVVPFWECCELNELPWSEKWFVTLKEYANNIAADNQGPALKEKENGSEEMVNDWALGCLE